MTASSATSINKVDLEGAALDTTLPQRQRAEPTSTAGRVWRQISQGISLEAHGVVPLTPEERTDTNFLKNFTLWVSMNGTISAFSTGTLGPLLFSLSMRDSFLCIVLLNLFSCAMPSYFAVFGPRLGMRTMTIARYSYGYYGAILPALLNLVTFVGFCAINAIVAGQVLVAVNPGHLSINVGIVIVSVISMIVSFCGYKIMHAFERFAWIPVIISFILLAGIGGRHLGAATEFDLGPATAGSVLSFAGLIVGFSLSWCGCSADFNTYARVDVSPTKIFAYTFAGLYLPCALIQMLGAAFAAAAMSGSVATWETAFYEGSTGGLVAVALEPYHGFGKLLLVIFAIGMIANNAPTTYAFSLSLQIVFPFLTSLPRFLFPIVCTAIYLPIAIVGAQHFAAALSNFLGIIGYWSACFASVFVVEHLVFRKRFSAYDISAWDTARLLPPGIAALFASLCGAGLVAASMDQVWWRGPIAKLITGPDAHYGGDMGIWLGIAASVVVYLVARPLERRLFGR